MGASIATRRLLLPSLLAAISGCHTATDAPPDADGPDPLERPRETREPVLDEKPLERAPLLDRTGGGLREVPESLLERIRADLRTRVGHGRSARLSLAESVVWPSGALGCPVSGMAYTQALVPGYHVIFEVAGDRWDYRASQGGTFRLCESRPLAPNPSP